MSDKPIDPPPPETYGTEDDGTEDDEAVSPLEGLLNPEEGENSPAADADVQPPA